MISFQSKLPQTGTTIFSVMSSLAQQAGAINLSQGFPDFDCPPELVKLVDQAMQSGQNQYAPMPGVFGFTGSDLRQNRIFTRTDLSS